MAKRYHQFDCQMYVAARGVMHLVMPYETGPRRVIRLEPVTFERLTDPTFANLLNTFSAVSSSLPVVQVS